MSWSLVQNDKILASYDEQTGVVEIKNQFMAKGLTRIGIPIPPAQQSEFGDREVVKLEPGKANPLFAKAFKELYAPQNIIGKLPGNVTWIEGS